MLLKYNPKWIASVGKYIRCFHTGIVSICGSLNTTTGQNVSVTCDFSGYLPGDYNITWTGPQGAVLTTSGRHAIFIDNGLNQSQSGGDSPGPSVLSTLTIFNVEEMDEGTYTCSMMGLSGPQLMDSIELIVTVLFAATSSPFSVSPSPFSGACDVDL